MLEYFQSLADWYMQHMNYFTITMLMAIESSFVPLPSEVVIPPAIWQALKTGELNVYLVVVFATIGAVIGALFNYVMARWLGRVIVYSFAESKVGKLFLLTAGANQGNYWFIIIAGLNMVISLYYYLRVVRAMFMDKNDLPIEKIRIPGSTRLGMIICAAGIVLVGLLSWIYDYIQSLS